jgi:hypothetical protein
VTSEIRLILDAIACLVAVTTAVSLAVLRPRL